MSVFIALFVSGRENFFKEGACINCSVNEYCACGGADVLFDIDTVMRQRLINVGQGVFMSELLKVEKGLLKGGNIFASLSHEGILAIYVSGNTMQFTDLNDGRQVEMRVEESLAGFYDNMILLLTWGEPLREATVEEVFSNEYSGVFKVIEGTSYALPFADVSLLQARRVIYYPSDNFKLFAFNVDTRENNKIKVKKVSWSVTSFTGIDCGVKAIFQNDDHDETYVLNTDNTLTMIDGNFSYIQSAVLPSAANTKDITDAAFKYEYDLMKGENKLDTRRLIEFECNRSLIRVYKDIFLVYDYNTESWVLFRLIVP